jgi:hypothetical protein
MNATTKKSAGLNSTSNGTASCFLAARVDADIVKQPPHYSVPARAVD